MIVITTVNVVLTRPAPRNKELLQLLTADGIEVLDLPALVLEEQANSVIADFNLDNYDAVFFVSRLAAELFLKNWTKTVNSHGADAKYQKWRDDLLVCAVGFSSAKPLIDAGFINSELIIYPNVEQINQDSEALWKLIKPKINKIKKTLIIRGQTGREWLTNKLTDSGVCVDKIAIYNRKNAIWNQYQIKQLTAMLADKQKQTVFLLTSSDSLLAIYDNIVANKLLNLWANCVFVCVHNRIATRLQAILNSSEIKVNPNILITTPINQDIYNTICSVIPTNNQLGLQSSYESKD